MNRNYLRYLPIRALISLLLIGLPGQSIAAGQADELITLSYQATNSSDSLQLATMVVDPQPQQPKTTRTADVAELDAGNFVKEALDSKRPVYIYVYSSKSPVCRFQTPLVQEAARLYKESVKFVKLDVDKHAQLAADLGLDETPAHIFKQPGSDDVLVARGFLEKDALPQFIAAGMKR